MVVDFAPLGSLDHVLSKDDEDSVDISNLVKITVVHPTRRRIRHDVWLMRSCLRLTVLGYVSKGSRPLPLAKNALGLLHGTPTDGTQ